VDSLNIQLCPTPIFYLKRGEIRRITDAVGSAGSITKGFSMNSTSYALTEAFPLNVNFAHGLGAMPSYLRAVLLCTTNDAGSATVAGQEVDADTMIDQNNSFIPFSSKADATKIYLSSESAPVGTNIYFAQGGVMSHMTSLSNFSLKVYWQ
jgi:hypothetical protein